jgi:hypothetical protein
MAGIYVERPWVRGWPRRRWLPGVSRRPLGLLEERGRAHTFFDLDGLTYLYPKPPDDRCGEGFALDALGLFLPRLRDTGMERLILARVLWTNERLSGYRRTIPDAAITVVRLTAPLEVIEARIRRREVGSATEWYLTQARESQERWGSSGRRRPHRYRGPRCALHCRGNRPEDRLELTAPLDGQLGRAYAATTHAVRRT